MCLSQMCSEKKAERRPMSFLEGIQYLKPIPVLYQINEFASSCEECMALTPLESIIPSQNEANKSPKPSLAFYTETTGLHL